jgi:inosine-uridine nucleoside N-ribohydrolase
VQIVDDDCCAFVVDVLDTFRTYFQRMRVSFGAVIEDNRAVFWLLRRMHFSMKKCTSVYFLF